MNKHSAAFFAGSRRLKLAWAVLMLVLLAAQLAVAARAGAAGEPPADPASDSGTTNVDPGLKVTQALLVVRPAKTDSQEVSISEYLTLVNPSDQTYTPSMDGPAGPMGLVRFGLPAAARGLEAGTGLDAKTLIQVDRGFASMAPLTPGEHDISFAYRLPYQGEQVTLDKSLVYGAAMLIVLTPQGGPAVSGEGLTAQKPITLDGVAYQAWVARDLAPGARLNLAVRGLPAPPATLQAVSLVARPFLLPGALVLVLLAGVLWSVRAGGLRAVQTARPTLAAAPVAAPRNHRHA